MKTEDQTDRQPQVAASAVVCDGREVAKCPRCEINGSIWWRCQLGYNHEAFCPDCDDIGNRRDLASRSHTSSLLSPTTNQPK